MLHQQGPNQLFTWVNFRDLMAARPLLICAKFSRIHISSSLLQYIPFLYKICYLELAFIISIKGT